VAPQSLAKETQISILKKIKLLSSEFLKSEKNCGRWRLELSLTDARSESKKVAHEGEKMGYRKKCLK
jgi:hypothetical protein